MPLSIDLPLIITKMAEDCPNTTLTPAQKTLIQNRLNQLLCQAKTPDHPPYSAMIERAIVELSEKGGSSQESISKFLETEYKDLPTAHLTLLKHHLEKLCESGDIILASGKRYVISGANPSLKANAKSGTTPVKRIWKWDWDRQQRRLEKQLVQKKNSLKVTAKSEKSTVKTIFKWDWERKQRRLKKQLVQKKNSLKVTAKSEKLPVKRIFKWDWERKQRRLKKQLVQKKIQMKCDKIEVTEKQFLPNTQENGLVEEEQANESFQALVMAEPKKRVYRKRLKGHGLISEMLRRSKRLQNDLKQMNEEEKKPDLSTGSVPTTEELSEPKCVQMQTRRSKKLAETRPEIKLCSELKRPQDHEIQEESSQITELQEKESENQISENQKADVVIKKFEEPLKTYGRRRKAEFDQERVIVEDTQKKVASGVVKSEISSLCLDINEDLNLEQVTDASNWISGKRLRPRRQISDSRVVEESDKPASCSKLLLRTQETLKTVASVSNDTEKLPEERPKVIRRLGRPPKRRCLADLLKDKMESP